MKTTIPLILATMGLLPLASFAQEEARGSRVAVIPFAALSGDVPQRAGAKAAGMLSSELKNADGLALVDLRRQALADPYQEELESARTQVQEALALRTKRRFRAAEEVLTKALASYHRAAGGLSEVAELQDAYALLSALQYNTGRDEEGASSLNAALALDPARELPLAKSSPLFGRVVQQARLALDKGPKGTILVESSPQGAAVTVDGVGHGQTPLLVKDVPPGPHAWRVQLPSGEAIGAVAMVVGGKQTKVTGAASGQDAESRLLSALAQNRIDQAAVEAARQQAKEVEADLLIFGALSRDGKNLALDSFVLRVESGEVRRLPRSSFDTELLSAGMEFYNLVGRLAADGLKVGAEVRVPGPVSADLKAGAVKVAEVSYRERPAQGEGGVLEPVVETRERTPLEPKKRTPLRRNP